MRYGRKQAGHRHHSSVSGVDGRGQPFLGSEVATTWFIPFLSVVTESILTKTKPQNWLTQLKAQAVRPNSNISSMMFSDAESISSSFVPLFNNDNYFHDVDTFIVVSLETLYSRSLLCKKYQHREYYTRPLWHMITNEPHGDVCHSTVWHLFVVWVSLGLSTALNSQTSAVELVTIYVPGGYPQRFWFDWAKGEPKDLLF